MPEYKVQLRKEDEKDIQEHLGNIGELSKQISTLVGQRLREVKAAKRIWESASLRAKVEGNLPKDVDIPVLLDQNTLRYNIAITDRVASWKEEPLKIEPKPKPKKLKPNKQANKSEELQVKEPKEVTDGIDK